ncbi:MAG TPA: transcription termination factor NusA [Oligoflexia bacterium]|nr:transcription termination factor NusA [Oligoflexia bacterium]HMP49091.1 transcription termination factor NusA [Oligoflexia bacterium]
MGIKFDLDQIISQVGRDKGINKQTLIDALESAVLSAAKKHFGHNLNLEATYNAEIGEIEVHEFKTVVAEKSHIDDPATQVVLAEARKTFDPDCEVGDEIGKKLDSTVLGRIAAQTAKQVISQKLRDAERDIIYSEYKDRKGEIVSGIVQRFEKGNLIVNLGRTDAILPFREQMQKERYRQGDRIRAMILDIYPISRGPQVVLTRSHPEFMRKLFEAAVPEIGENIIEIKSVSREPGERAKIAVYSTDPNIDPVGACVGVKGTRVQSVVSELRGEKIDIVTWTPDAPSFVARALSPADVVRVIVDEDEHSMEVVVADEQLSLAIGRRGQNVKLATKLTGWRIDVRSESIAEEESKRARAALESIEGIGIVESELLYQEGYRSVYEVSQASLDDLIAIEGLEPGRASQILQAAQKLAEEESLLAPEIDAHGNRKMTDIDQLILPEEVREMLIDNGFDSIQSIAPLGPDELVEQAGLRPEEAEVVCAATEAFLRVQRPLSTSGVTG